MTPVAKRVRPLAGSDREAILAPSMALSAEAPVNPSILVWARHSIGVPEAHAAKKANVPLARLHEWETGAQKPSIAQLRNLADLYKRPLAVFFLDEVPRDFSVMKNFRRLPDSDETKLSPQLAAQTRAALIRRDVTLHLRTTTGETTPTFDLSADLHSSPAAVAARVRQALGVSFDEQVGWSNERNAFKAWRAAVEGIGALVFQVTRVKIEEMRGLSAFQKPLPVILINGADCFPGRTFSLFHELGHLLHHEVHLCDGQSESGWTGKGTEVWCNAFAANLLVPSDAITSEFRRTGRGPAGEPDWKETKRVAALFKVSQEVVLRRLVTLGTLSEAAYKGAREHLRDLEHPPKRKGKSSGGPPRDVVAVWTHGAPFIRSVLEALHQRSITLSDVSDYLDVKVKWVPRIRERVYFGGGTSDEEHPDL